MKRLNYFRASLQQLNNNIQFYPNTTISSRYKDFTLGDWSLDLVVTHLEIPNLIPGFALEMFLSRKDSHCHSDLRIHYNPGLRTSLASQITRLLRLRADEELKA